MIDIFPALLQKIDDAKTDDRKKMRHRSVEEGQIKQTEENMKSHIAIVSLVVLALAGFALVCAGYAQSAQSADEAAELLAALLATSACLGILAATPRHQATRRQTD
jgi:hypothetical protein